MKKLLALVLAAGLMVTSALALTPEQLGTILRENYAGEIPARVWQEDTVEGMLSALGDPFTHYYTAQEYAQFQSLLTEEGAGGPTAQVERADRVGRVRLSVFGQDTYHILKTGVESLDGQVDYWLVDLRGNGGGELRASIDAASVFTGGGRMAYLRDRTGQLYGGTAVDKSLTIDPAVALVDGWTASGAELFAAAVRDRRAGVVVGSRTYGKGVAQTALTQAEYPEAFADGSALLLTTERLFSSSFVSNNIVGVIPHLLVEDDYTQRVGLLLCGPSPRGNTQGFVRLVLGGWRWDVDPQAAQADPQAAQALLEAVPPTATLYLGTGGTDGWRTATPADAAAAWGLDGYSPRAFPDVAASPYAQAINALKTYDILKGDQNGNFNPGQGLTRASLCALLAQAMRYPMSSAAPAFADTPADAWYTPYVTTLSAMGIVNGYDDGLFHPDDPIPHQQFMAILSRIVADTHHTSWGAFQAGPDQETLDTGDYAAYDPWAVKGAWLLDGAWHAPARDIDPRAVTTREEAAYDLWSALTVIQVLPT